MAFLLLGFAKERSEKNASFSDSIFIIKRKTCKMGTSFPLILKYNYEDIYFRLSVTTGEDITEYVKKVECFPNFFIYTKLNENRNFDRFCEIISSVGNFDTREHVVNIECLESISLSENKFKLDDIKIFIKEFLFPKIEYYVFGDSDSNVYGSTQKIIKNENLGYTVEKHQKLYKKEISKRGFTPVEVCLFMKFDFENVYGF